MWFFQNLEEGHIVGMNVKMNKIRVGGFVLYFLILCPITPKKKITMKILKVQKHDEISNFFFLGASVSLRCCEWTFCGHGHGASRP
jgi:hypothetical protein